ncbi:MAG TPA: DUF2066 domain-containing protein [Kiloniellaceae bacterium]|nr:DUF2066 domain-containing protein [Kiloniellaceae bacterium]
MYCGQILQWQFVGAAPRCGLLLGRRKIVDPGTFAMRNCGKLALILLLALGLAGQTAAARADGVFTVRNVPVDVTADSAVQAREAAIAEAHMAALHVLLRRLVPQEELANLRMPSQNEVLNLAENFSVVNERTSNVRYLADFTVNFNGEAVQDYLRQSGVSFAVNSSKPILVVPVMDDGGPPRLWLDNPWYDLWLARPADEGLVPYFVPLGDLGDMASLDAAAALSLDSVRLRDLASRYGIDEVLVTHASLSGDPDAGTAALSVRSHQVFGPGSPSLNETFRQQPEETLDDLMARAADSLDSAVQEAWKTGNLLRFDSLRSAQMKVHAPNLNDWLEVRRRLANVASVDQVRIVSLSRAGSVIDVTYVGDEQQLTQALFQRDLRLALDVTGDWLLSLREAVLPSVTPLPASGTGTDDAGGAATVTYQ